MPEILTVAHTLVNATSDADRLKAARAYATAAGFKESDYRRTDFFTESMGRDAAWYISCFEG